MMINLIDMRTIHNLQLNMLEKIDEICKRFGLTYFMIGGSAIGTVRDHGFIPWDDDIDVGLIRSDFDKFIKDAPDYLFDVSMALEEDRLDSEFEFDFAKLMRTDTWIEEHGREDTRTRNGVFIDIFPFDRLPIDLDAQQQQAMQIKALKDEITARVYPNRPRQIATISGLKKLSLTQLYKRRYQVMTRYNDDARLPLANMSSPYAYAKEVILPNEISSFEQKTFETLQVPVISGYDSYLKRLYGDYMTVPPVNLQVSHHITAMTMLQSISEDEGIGA